MIGPIDYSLNVKSPFESAIGAYKIGSDIAEIQQQREIEKQKLQQQQIAAQEEARNKAYLTLGAQSLAALESGNTDAAINLIQSRIDAERNAGNENQANALNTWSALIKFNPQNAVGVLNRFITATPGGKALLDATKVAGEEWRAANLHPSELARNQAKARQERVKAFVDEETAESEISQAKSDAHKAAVAANFAQSNAVIDLEEKGWKIKNLQNDIQIAKQNAAIAAANNAIAREGNDLKRAELQLKLRDMQDKRDQTVRERVAEANTAAMQADNLLNTVDSLIPKLVDGVDKSGKPIFSSSFRATAGPVDSFTPTIQTDVATIQEQFETLGSQITMSRIGEMKGALSNQDLLTLRQSLQSLSLRQSEDQIYKNLKEIQRLTLKARKTAYEKYGLPETRPDTPSVEPSAQEVNDILKKYGR